MPRLSHARHAVNIDKLGGAGVVPQNIGGFFHAEFPVHTFSGWRHQHAGACPPLGIARTTMRAPASHDWRSHASRAREVRGLFSRRTRSRITMPSQQGMCRNVFRSGPRRSARCLRRQEDERREHKRIHLEAPRPQKIAPPKVLAIRRAMAGATHKGGGVGASRLGRIIGQMEGWGGRKREMEEEAGWRAAVGRGGMGGGARELSPNYQFFENR